MAKRTAGAGGAAPIPSAPPPGGGLRQAPAAIWAHVKRASGVFDAEGRFSWAGLFRFVFRLARARTIAFLRGTLTGLVSHFFLIAFQNGFNDVLFPRSLFLPVFNVLRPGPGTATAFTIATSLWGAASAVLTYVLRSRRNRTANAPAAASFLPWITGTATLLLSGHDAWADDGGFSEWSRGQSFTASGGAALLGQSGVVGVAVGLGSALGEEAADAAGRRPRVGPALIDPDDGEPLTVNDGSWPDVPVGHVWYGEWLPPETAAQWIRERRDQLRARQAEIDRFTEETDAMREARRAQVAERLRSEGYVYDPETDTWVLDRSGHSPDGRDAQGFDRSGYDREGFDRDGYDREGFDRNGYGRNGFDRNGVNAEGERIEDVRERMRARQQANEEASSGWTPWLSGYAEGFAEGVRKDVASLPDVAADAAAAAVDGMKDLLRAAADRENWRIARETVTGTAHDVFVDPSAGARKVWESSKEAGGAAAEITKAVVQNPLAVAKALVGLDNWERAIDPKVRLGQRIGAALMGALDVGMSFAGGAAAKGAAAADDVADAVRGAKAAEAARDAAKAADAASDAARTARGADAASDTARAARGADTASDSVRAGRGAEEAAGAARRAPDPDKYAEFQKYKGDVAQSTRADVAPGGGVIRREVGVGDYAPAVDRATGAPLKPDVRGMPPRNVRHAQVVADKYGVQIQVRPTNKDARELLESGRALPKPAKIKAKTVNDLDVLLGAPQGSNGKVAVFWPKDPPGVAQGMIENKEAFEAWKSAEPVLAKRYSQRMKEFTNEMSDMRKLADEGKIVWDPKNPVILDKKTGLPFTGDHDVFDIRGANGERVGPTVRAQILKELEGPPYRNQHGAHMDWDYADKPHFEKNRAIDERILAGHMESEAGETLITVGADREISASWSRLEGRSSASGVEFVKESMKGKM
jgi:hypothetical protein